MDNLIEEVEIKIEYNESLEMDPLSDKSVNSPESCIGIRKACVSDNNKHLQSNGEDMNKNNEGQNGNEKVVSDKTMYYFSSNSKFHTNNHYSNNSPRNKVSWYDSIDDSGRYLCKFCGLKYSTLQTLRFHVKNKHPDQVNHIKENIVKYKRNSKLKCHICKQRFKEILALKSHVVNNHSLENIKASCLYCDATFNSEDEMSEHTFIQHKKVIHKSTYMCEICGYRTSTKSHYNQHKNVHVEHKSKKCEYCDYATNYLPNLKIHQRIHTKDKKYVCDYMNCKYKCSSKTALRSHQLKHNPEDNILYCDKCSYKTIYRQCLKRHDDCHKRNSVKLKLHR